MPILATLGAALIPRSAWWMEGSAGWDCMADIHPQSETPASVLCIPGVLFGFLESFSPLLFEASHPKKETCPGGEVMYFSPLSTPEAVRKGWGASQMNSRIGGSLFSKSRREGLAPT